MKKFLNLSMFSQVFTVLVLVAVLGWFTLGAIVEFGNTITILPANEFNQVVGSASLEADADYLHGLKASGLK